jgi:aminoglycoside 2'-N-acetyltransferase I
MGWSSCQGRRRWRRSNTRGEPAPGLGEPGNGRAADKFSSVHSVDFALLFCEPRHAPVYQKLGWHAFAGDVFVAPLAGRVHFAVTDPYVLHLRMSPRNGEIDLCGLPW